ncbi:MAG: cytochrome b/b6 domain-containing protein [Gemmatimonadales bacterium]
MTAVTPGDSAVGPHARWVRVTHWITALTVLALAGSGFWIFRVHPRLYWGQVGNDLTPALIQFPIAPNYPIDAYTDRASFPGVSDAVVTASRTREPWNQNGWARSLHFLAGWLLVIPGLSYLWLGVSAGHFRRHVVPRAGELAPSVIGREMADHVRLRIPRAQGGPAYGSLQKLAYTAVIFLLVPVIVLSGLTMAPGVTAGWPWLLDLFGGHQSARTIHFLAFALLLGFLFTHLAMVALSGFRTQLRGMTIGVKP